MANQFPIEDIGNLTEQFANLSEQMQGRIGWGAAKKAAGVIRDAAEENAKRIDAPKRPGDKIDSKIYPYIVVQKATKIGKAEKAVAYRVGVQGQAIYEGVREPPTYWRFVELGTAKTPAQPFLRPAMQSNQGKVVQVLKDELWRRITKEVDKQKRGGKK